MKPRAFNRICAHPEAIAWAVGATVLDVALLAFLCCDGTLFAIVSDWRALLLLLLALVSATLLGFFLGMFTVWPLIRVWCSRHNGAPLKPGDRVMVLSGRMRGTVTEVYEMTVGQGGWNLARLDLGAERKKSFTDIFEEYAVFKMGKGEHAGGG